jgi:acetolactate synthase-1/2/3 large subunit
VTQETITGGDAIVQGLLAEGVDTVFGIPGVQTYELFDALGRAGDRIRIVTPRHEQACAYMAFGYARATGRTGVYSVVPGPGILNSGAGLCTAYGASMPVLCLTSEVPTPYIGSGLGHLHELPDQLGTLRTLTKWAQRIDHPTQAPAMVIEGLRRAASGRPRPVALEMPWDALGIRAAVDPGAGLDAVGEVVPDPDPDRVSQAARLLAGARNPMIMVGSGAMDAGPEVLALAERLGAPVVSFRGGRGVVDDDHPLGLTCAAGFEVWHDTDVVVGIGTRMELLWFRWPDRPAGLQVVSIDVDATQPLRIGADVAITADAAAGATALLAEVERVGASPSGRVADLPEVKAGMAERVQEISPHAQHLAAIREVLPRDGILVEEVCQAGFLSYNAFPVHEPRTFVSGGHQGALGFGFATALGAKVARPDRGVVSITGDGGFQFGLQELATAAQEGIGLVTVLFDNAAYGNVLRDQQRLFEGREVSSRLRNPDWIALAESFGVAGRRAATPADLGREVAASLEDGGPALVVVPVDATTESSPWPLLMPASRR